MFEPVFYDPVVMPANPTARYGYVSKEQLKENRYNTRLKPGSNKYRYKITRTRRSIVCEELVNMMKSTSGYIESKRLEIQNKFAEQSINMVKSLLSNETNITLGGKE